MRTIAKLGIVAVLGASVFGCSVPPPFAGEAIVRYENAKTTGCIIGENGVPKYEASRFNRVISFPIREGEKKIIVTANAYEEIGTQLESLLADELVDGDDDLVSVQGVYDPLSQTIEATAVQVDGYTFYGNNWLDKKDYSTLPICGE